MADLIDRQAALDALSVYIHLIDKTMGKGTLTDDDCMEAAKSVLGEDELPAVQPDHVADIGKKAEKEDCISRQAALNAITDELMSSTPLSAVIRAKNRIKDLPAVQPDLSEYSDKLWKSAYERGRAEAQDARWIPCGERLPEEKQSVLVTDGSIVWVCDIISTDEGYKWEDSHGYWLDLDEWTAWMPLPEPYRGGDE